MTHYDAVVIGAGNAGICAAMAFAQSGMKTLVLEQHNLPGGCATSFVRGRFEFDASLHSIDYAGLFRSVFEGKMGITEKFPKSKPGFCNVYVENGKTHVEYYRTDQDMAQQVEEKHPGCGKLYSKILSTMEQCMKAFSSLISGNPNIPAILFKYPKFLKYGTKTLQQVLDKYDAPAYLRTLFSILWWYGGAAPKDFPFIVYSLMEYPLLAGTMNFPENTSHGYMAELERKIREFGGDIWYNTKATKINTENGKVISVETSQGDVISTDLVISNASPETVMKHMITGDEAAVAEEAEKLSTIQENFSFFTIYLGLDRSAEELGIKDHHTFINESMDLNEIYSCSGSFEGPKTIGFNCPNITVPGFSPEGTCIATISIPVQGSILNGMSQKEYLKMKHEVEKIYVAKVEKYLGIDLHDHIEEIDLMTPETLARYVGLKDGALGPHIKGDNSGKVRKSTAELNNGKIQGLSFIGQWSGNLGYQNSINGYMEAEKIIQKHQGGKYND